MSTKSNVRQRTSQVLVRLTPEEDAALREVAAAHGLTRQELIRAALAARPEPRIDEVLQLCEGWRLSQIQRLFRAFGYRIVASLEDGAE